MVAAVILGALSFFTMAAEIGRPFGGFLSNSIPFQDAGHLSEKTPRWWPVYSLGAEVQDIYSTIDGLPYTPNVDRIFRQSEPGQEHVITLTHRDDGQEAEMVVTALPFTVQHFLDLKLPELIVAASFLILAAIVLRAAPGQLVNRVYAGLTISIAAHRLLNVNTLYADNRWWPNVLEACLLAVSAGLVATAFHFAWVFPTPLPQRPRRLIKLYYLAGIILAIALVLGRSPWWPPGVEPPNWILNEYFYQILLYMYLISLAAICVRLVYSVLRERNTRRERRILLLTLSGIVLALPFLLTQAGDVLPGLASSANWQNLDLRYLLLAIPLGLAMAIIRYQNLTTPPPAFLFVAVLGASALLANIAAWLWMLVQPGVYYDAGRQPFLPFFVVIFGASLFWIMQTTWSGWFGRFLQRERINYRATRNVGRRLQATTDSRTLPQALAEAINDELGLNATAVWLARPENGVFELAGLAGEVETPLPALIDIPDNNPDREPRRLGSARPLPDWLAPLAEPLSVEIVAPLWHDAEPVALLGFGRRWDEEIFDEDDIVILELIAQQALLYLQVAQQIDALRQVPHQITEAQERERMLLAAELHDTIQQFLGRLPFFLVASKEAMVDDPEDAAELLERSLSDIEEAAQTVQRIRQNLAPSQLERSLTRSLSVLAAHTEQRYGLEVPLDVAGDVDAATDLETRQALYRVVQHALDNATMHAEASVIQVRMQQQDGQIIFDVHDDGRGATPEELALARRTGHFGLQSMQVRIEACGGQFEFVSQPGEGTRVAGWVPTANNEQR